jgi:hypothetical protein
MNSSMTAKADMQSITLIVFFALCQIIGTMCAVPDLSLADDVAQLAEDMSDMACPMDGTIMCPPSAKSSPERQLKHSVAIDLNQTPVLLAPVAAITAFPTSAPWCWISTSEIVPISIASPSVLRI